MADLILAKLALWGTDTDTFALAASRSDGDGSLSAMLTPHHDPSLQILLTHEPECPVHLVSYASVPAHILADSRLNQILLFLEETRPANLTVRIQSQEELEISLWIFEEGFDRQSLNLAVSEHALVRRILSRRLQSLNHSAEVAPVDEAVAPVPTAALAEPQPVPAPSPVSIAEPVPAVAAPVDSVPESPAFDPYTSSGGGSSSGVRARRGASLPPPAPVPESQPEAQPPTPPEKEAPAFDPFASQGGTKKGPATLFPGTKESVKVSSDALPGLAGDVQEAAAPASAPTEPEGRPAFDPFSSKGGGKNLGPATIFPGAKQPMKVLPTMLPGLGAKKEEPSAVADGDMKNCPKCNGELRAKARFCTWCGHRY